MFGRSSSENIIIIYKLVRNLSGNDIMVVGENQIGILHNIVICHKNVSSCK